MSLAPENPSDLFILLCGDKPASQNLRLENRDNHLKWVATKSHLVRLAGPLLSDDGKQMIGSLFILECGSAAAARAFNSEDPYTQAGLWQSVIVRPFRQVIPEPNPR